MYRCHVEKKIWWDPLQASGFTRLYYDLELDEAPVVGQQLRDDRWFSGVLTFVVWNIDAERFNCRVADESPSLDADYEYSHEFMVENAVLEGWHTA